MATVCNMGQAFLSVSTPIHILDVVDFLQHRSWE